MSDWSVLYAKCPYYSYEITDHDFIGHDSIASYCSVTGQKQSIYHTRCKACDKIPKMKEFTELPGIDVTDFSAAKAAEFIHHKCNDCRIRMNCSGNDSAIYEQKVQYLLTKYSDKHIF